MKIKVAAGPDLRVSFPSGGAMLDGVGKRIKSFRPGEQFSWMPDSSSRSEKTDPRKSRRREKPKRDPFTGKTFQFVSGKLPLEINGKGFRGTLIVSFSPAGALVVNQISVEDYVKGVVGCEVGSGSPPETLKAQAVIARTYGLANKGKHGKEGFDLCNIDHCQAYGGVKAERATVNSAVDSTRGIVMISDGQLISTMYHSTCGGYTSNNEDVYGGKPAGYLRRVKCDFCRAGTNYRWVRRLPLDFIQRRLAADGIMFNRILDVDVESPQPLPSRDGGAPTNRPDGDALAGLDRVSSVNLSTDRGLVKIKGTTFRRLFQLPSTTFIAPAKPAIRQYESLVIPQNTHGDQVLSKLGLLTESLILLSGDGIKRTRRPKEGWMALSCITGGGASLSERVSPSLDGTSFQTVPYRKGEEFPPVLQLNGRGYGHQVGLCQSGCVALGNRGWSYRQILAYYYSNVSLRILK